MDTKEILNEELIIPYISLEVERCKGHFFYYVFVLFLNTIAAYIVMVTNHFSFLYVFFFFFTPGATNLFALYPKVVPLKFHCLTTLQIIRKFYHSSFNSHTNNIEVIFVLKLLK